MPDSSLQTVVAIVFLIAAVGAIALTFFSAVLYGAIHPEARAGQGSGSNVRGAAGAIIIFGLKRKLKRMLFRGLI